MARKGHTKVIYKGTFVCKQTLVRISISTVFYGSQKQCYQRTPCISIFSALVASSVGVKPKKLLIHTVLDYTVHYMYVSRQSGQHLRKEVTAETSTLLPRVTLIVEFTFLMNLLSIYSKQSKSRLRPGIFGIYFLSFPHQKPLTMEN